MSIEPIFLDIETIPTQSQRILLSLREKAQAELNEQLEAVRAPGNYTKPETIEKYIAERRAELQEKAAAELEKAFRSTSLDGAFGQVAVCSMAAGDRDPVAIYEEDWENPRAERLVLERVNDAIADHCAHHRGQMLIGHNISFDRRMLRQRGIVHGMRMHRLITMEVKPWEMGQVIFDTMLAWTGDPRGTISLDKLCLALGIPGKGEIDGSKVWDYVKAGRIHEVAAYCNDDVAKRTRPVYRRLMLLDLPQPQPAFDDVPA